MASPPSHYYTKALKPVFFQCPVIISDLLIGRPDCLIAKTASPLTTQVTLTHKHSVKLAGSDEPPAKPNLKVTGYYY